MNNKALVTGSGGLIGSEAVMALCGQGYEVIGIDNDLRSYFFGEAASTKWNSNRLQENFRSRYKHYSIDIRNYSDLEAIFRENRFDLVIHAAAQPSHDWAAKDPLMDFSVNALGTLNLLELTRLYSPEATFIFTSTNKVYGDRPNTLPLIEMSTRWEIESHHEYFVGINELMSIDQSTHSLFGASKVSADILVQEYGRYFDMNTAVFRGGCLTGPMHSAAELHGFLAYLVKSIQEGNLYTIFGYKGKQVRDNIHSRDLISMFMHFHKNPKKAAVYNTGGGRSNSISILEAISKIESASGKMAKVKYSEINRKGDHIWYISDLTKFETDYPDWAITYGIDDLIEEMVNAVNL